MVVKRPSTEALQPGVFCLSTFHSAFRQGSYKLKSFQNFRTGMNPELMPMLAFSALLEMCMLTLEPRHLHLVAGTWLQS
jgi:hypothetical protein